MWKYPFLWQKNPDQIHPYAFYNAFYILSRSWTSRLVIAFLSSKIVSYDVSHKDKNDRRNLLISVTIRNYPSWQKTSYQFNFFSNTKIYAIHLSGQSPG